MIFPPYYCLNLQRTIRPPSSPVLQSNTVKSDAPACSQEATLRLQQKCHATSLKGNHTRARLLLILWKK